MTWQLSLLNASTSTCQNLNIKILQNWVIRQSDHFPCSDILLNFCNCLSSFTDYRSWKKVLNECMYNIIAQPYKQKDRTKITCTGCSLNIVFFRFLKKYSRLWPFSVSPRCQCVYTHLAGRTPHQHYCRTGKVQKNHKILRKKHNI